MAPLPLLYGEDGGETGLVAATATVTVPVAGAVLSPPPAGLWCQVNDWSER